MYEYPEDIKPVPPPQTKPDLFARLVGIARWLLIPYAGAILLGGFLTVAIGALGLAVQQFFLRSER